MATQAERTAALEAQTLTLQNAVIALQDTVQALAQRLVEAHGRIDHAGQLFTDMRRALRPKTQPASAWIPPKEYNAAVLELRGNDPHSLERFAPADIAAKVAERRARHEAAQA